MNDYIHSYISDFFIRYLPEQRGFAPNTITSYKYTFIILLEFFKEKYNINTNKMLLSDFKLQFTAINLKSTKTGGNYIILSNFY